METTVKGDIDELLKIVKQAQQRCIDYASVELITNIKIHHKTAEATDTFCTYDRRVTKNNAVFIWAQEMSNLQEVKRYEKEITGQ